MNIKFADIGVRGNNKKIKKNIEMFIKKANTTEGHISTEDIRTNFEYEIRYLKKYFDLNTISVQSHKEELETSLLNEIELEPSKESILMRIKS